MHINPEVETSFTTQYQDAFLKYEENEYGAKHRCVLANKPESILRSTLVSSATSSGCSQSYSDPYDLSSNDEEYLTPNHVG